MSDNSGMDDFRKSAAFLNELDDGTPKRAQKKRTAKSVSSTQTQERGLFGLQPGAAFFLSALFFIFVCLAGFAVLIVFEKVALPI